MQRGDVRKKYNIKGSTAKDIVTTCFCPLCSIVQTEKESDWRAAQALTAEQPTSQPEMAYAPTANQGAV